MPLLRSPASRLIDALSGSSARAPQGQSLRDGLPDSGHDKGFFPAGDDTSLVQEESASGEATGRGSFVERALQLLGQPSASNAPTSVDETQIDGALSASMPLSLGQALQAGGDAIARSLSPVLAVRVASANAGPGVMAAVHEVARTLEALVGSRIAQVEKSRHMQNMSRRSAMGL
jgi:hypothetical protein